MIPFVNSMSLASGGADPYATYLAYLDSQKTTSTVYDFDYNLNFFWPVPGAWRVNCSALNTSHTMIGTPWDNYPNDARVAVTNATKFSRIIQHCCPTQAIFNNLCNNSRQVLLKVHGTGVYNEFQSYARNGYTSLENPTPEYDLLWFSVNQMYYWDESLGARGVTPVHGYDDGTGYALY